MIKIGKGVRYHIGNISFITFIKISSAYVAHEFTLLHPCDPPPASVFSRDSVVLQVGGTVQGDPVGGQSNLHMRTVVETPVGLGQVLLLVIWLHLFEGAIHVLDADEGSLTSLLHHHLLEYVVLPCYSMLPMCMPFSVHFCLASSQLIGTSGFLNTSTPTLSYS